MIMELPVYWSVLRIVVIVLSYRGNVFCERVQGCVGSRLSLRCPEKEIIRITVVSLGDSKCEGSKCCIKEHDCTKSATANHIKDVSRRCDDMQHCTVDVIKDKIDCGFLGKWSNNDFERITYICLRVDEPQMQESVVGEYVPDDNNDEEKTTEPDDSIFSDYLTSDDGTLKIPKETEEERDPETTMHQSNSHMLPVVVGIVCFTILLGIVVLIVVMYHRKKKRYLESSDAVKMSDLETRRNETVDVNEAQLTNPIANSGSTFPIFMNGNSDRMNRSTSLMSGAMNFEAPTNDYCALEGTDRGIIQCDSEYEQLDHGRNYEPLIVYEQLNTAVTGSYLTLIN